MVYLHVTIKHFKKKSKNGYFFLMISSISQFPGSVNYFIELFFQMLSFLKVVICILSLLFNVLADL